MKSQKIISFQTVLRCVYGNMMSKGQYMEICVGWSSKLPSPDTTSECLNINNEQDTLHVHL